MIEFIDGATTMACVVSSLRFWRLWRSSLDRLPLLLSLAFLVLAVSYGLRGLSLLAEGSRALSAFRLFGFVLMGAAVVDKVGRRV
jgi:hypothetical protein